MPFGLDFKDMRSFLISFGIFSLLLSTVLWQSYFVLSVSLAIGGIILFNYGLIKLIKKDYDDQKWRELENKNKELTNKLNEYTLDLNQKTIDFEVDQLCAEVDCASDLETVYSYGREDYCHTDRPFVVYTIRIVIFNKSAQLDKSIRKIGIIAD